MSPALERLEASLAALREGRSDIARLAQAWRGEAALLAALPPRFVEVLDQVLMRFESGSLFAEDSCSFSQRDLIEALNAWLAKAGEHLDSLE